MEQSRNIILTQKHSRNLTVISLIINIHFDLKSPEELTSIIFYNKEQLNLMTRSESFIEVDLSYREISNLLNDKVKGATKEQREIL